MCPTKTEPQQPATINESWDEVCRAGMCSRTTWSRLRPRPGVFEAKAKAKARSFRIKATYTYKSYMTSEAP